MKTRTFDYGVKGTYKHLKCFLFEEEWNGMRAKIVAFEEKVSAGKN